MQHMGTKLLQTDRLILRPFTMADAQAMYDNWASDPAITEHLSWPAQRSINDSIAVLEEWTADYEKSNFYQWAIVCRESGNAPIGSISVLSIDEQVLKAHIGYCIGKRWWHQGITTEALRAVIRYLFDEVGLQRIESMHDPRNPNSGAVMQKCGMQYEGTLRHFFKSNQGICDACFYSILSTDEMP